MRNVIFNETIEIPLLAREFESYPQMNVFYNLIYVFNVELTEIWTQV